MKNKKLVSKIGAIALCVVMAVISVVSVNAAAVGDNAEVGYNGSSTGYGALDLKMETTGQTVYCKKGYVFPNSDVKVDKEFKMPQIKLGKGETFRYYLYNYRQTNEAGDPVIPLAYKSVKSFWSWDWKGQSTAGNLTTGFSNKANITKGGKHCDRYTVSIKGNSKCTYNLVVFDTCDTFANKGYLDNFHGKSITKASVLYSKYPIYAVSVYDAPSSVSLKRSDNKSSISGKTVTLKRGQTLSIYESTPLGSYANAKNVTYSTTNKNVATVAKNSTFSGSAKITAVKKGTATITVKLYNGITASVKINVK